MKNQALSPAPAPVSHDHIRGSVLMWIFIAVALFAGLSFVMSQGFRTGAGNLTGEKARLAASEFVSYGEALSQTIRSMRINGCSDTQISFERAPFDGSDTIYVNPNSPANFSCHVFHSRGGGMNPAIPEKQYLNGTPGVDARFAGKYVFTAKACVGNVGSGGNMCWHNGTNDDVELLLIATDIQQDVCLKINEMSGVQKIPVMNAGNGNFFDYSNSEFRGVYGESATDSGHVYIDDPADRAAIETADRRYLCYLDGTPNVNVMYYVLIAR